MTEPSATSGLPEKARRTLEELLQKMGVEAQVAASESAEGEVLLRIECADAAPLIGRRGQALDALQFILSRMLFRQGEPRRHVVVDVGGYRERRREQILREARAAIEQVAQTGRPVKLPVMSAAERRLVHHLVAEKPGLGTYSEPTEDEGRKRVVIHPAKPPATPESPPPAAPQEPGPAGEPPAP